MVEKSGILFAYLGAGEPPAFPHFDCFVAPDAYTFAFKGYWDCNWLQALEVGIDPAHASWLHKFFEDEDPAASYGRQFRGTPADSEMPISKVLREYDRPEIRVERTAYGMRLHTLRRISDAHTHIRVTNILFPQAFVIPMNAEMTISQWHVPVDDTGCYWYSIFTSFGAPVDKDTMREQRLKTYPAPDYKPIVIEANSWGFDAGRAEETTFTGMGFDINIHDQWACESQGPIQDRTRRISAPPTRASCSTAGSCWTRSARTERARSRSWCSMLTARPPGRLPIDGIGPTATIDEYWKEVRPQRAAGTTPGPHEHWLKGLKAVRFSFADQHGVLRGKTLAAGGRRGGDGARRHGHEHAALKDTSHRTVFPAFTPGGGVGMPEMQGAADILMIPDPSTFRVLPWAPDTGWLCATSRFPDGRRCPSARAICWRRAAEARSAGLRVRRRPRGRVPRLQDPAIRACSPRTPGSRATRPRSSSSPPATSCSPSSGTTSSTPWSRLLREGLSAA